MKITEDAVGKKILFIPMSWGRGMGPLMDCLAVAENARSIGCQVAFLCRDRFYEIIKEFDYPIYKVVSPKSPTKLNQSFNTDFPFFQGLGDEKLVKQTIEDEMKAIKNYCSDVVFSWLQFTAYISTKTLGVPLASVGRWTGHPKFTSPMLKGGRFPISATTPLFNQLLKKYNLPSIRDIWELDFIRSDLKIIPGTPELEPGLKELQNSHYVGYLSSGNISKKKLPDRLIDLLPNQHIVFVYLSTKQFLPQDYLPIFKKAFDCSEFKVIVATGLEDMPSRLPTNSTNVQFEHLVSINTLLPKIDIIISTGTRGVSWQAALNGIAHISFPGTDPERYFVASMVERAGAGLTLPDSAFEPKRLLESVRLVYRSRMKEKAKKLGSRLRFLGGPQKTARLLMQKL